MDKEISYTLPIGTILNEKWVILEFIAKGGMGEVYHAHQLNLKRDVAIKIVSSEFIETLSGDEEEIENALQRFRQEVHTMVQIHHPNVIHIYDYETAELEKEGEPFTMEYMAMEYIPGRTLRGTMSEDGFYPDEELVRQWMIKYFLPVLDGVEAIHKAGIFHRDMKPENVLMDENIPKIADFGLAHSCKFKSVTCSVDLKGTPKYMAPEQFTDFKRTDQRTDIYALGKILFEAVDGAISQKTVPFHEVHLDKVETPFFHKLDQAIRKATSEESGQRFETISEFRVALIEAIEGARGQIKPEKGAKLQERRKKKRGAKWILFAGVGSFLVILVISSLVWFRLNGQKTSVPLKMQHETQSELHTTQSALHTAIHTIHTDLKTEDGVTLHLIPEGTLNLPANFDGGPTETVKIKSFYMDETQVTNYQYVVFLNHYMLKNPSKIQIDNGVVKNGDNIWCYLGEVMEGYEPITFMDGTFIAIPVHASCPVLRVTAYGAVAYAELYQRRLPTKTEWLYAAMEGKDSGHQLSQKDTTLLPKSFFDAVTLPLPVMMLEPNAYGIRGMNAHIGEWMIDALTYMPNTSPGKQKFAIMGGEEESIVKENVLPRPLVRKSGEAFNGVSFRCVKEKSNQN